jgi:3',5'-cyclic AMP phosphodiesterase CpdA
MARKEVEMLRIAHVSDVHVLETQPGASYGLDVRFLSFGRRLDAQARVRKLVAAITRAQSCGAHHVVVTGDLTESGSAAQFEALAEALAPFPDDKLTLVPGNHDAYGDPGAWMRALRGPLRRFARNAAMDPGRVLDLGEAFLFPMDVSFPQPLARAAGLLTESAARSLDRRLTDKTIAKKPQVVVQHHPPFPRINRAWDWVDGLRGGDRMLDMLQRHPQMYVLHGHLHSAKDVQAKIFGAPAVVEDEDDKPRVRLYEARDGGLEAAGLG